MINPSLELPPIDQAKKTATHLSNMALNSQLENSHQNTSPKKRVPHHKKKLTTQKKLEIKKLGQELLKPRNQFFSDIGNEHCEQGTVFVQCYPLAMAIEYKQTTIFYKLIDLGANPALPIDVNENVSYSLLSLIPTRNDNEDSLNTYLTAVLTLWAERFSN